MMWLGVLIAALITVPFSISEHERKAVQAQLDAVSAEQAQITAQNKLENDVYFYDQKEK